MNEVLCLGGLTVLEYWRQVRMRVAAANVPGEYGAAKPPLLVRLLFEGDPLLDLAAMPEASALTAAPATLDATLAAEVVRACPDLSAPLSCYVRNSAGRRYCAGVNTVTLGGEFPPGSFVWDARGFAVPAPELLALLLGRALSSGRLLMVLSELCGLYALGAAGAVAVPPLTTCEKIEAYACELAALRRGLGQRVPRGMPAVLESLPHVAERAASPTEAAIALLLGLPADVGGFGLPAASLNQKIVVAGSEYVCDLAWNDGSCLLEYQGETHKQRWRRASDRRKHNALRGDGRVLLEAGRDDLMTFAGMNQLASVLADVLGASLPPATKEALQRRIDLRTEVLECFSVRI